tara:strand:+ start:14407 stop:15783 length:1377 start_codon:yes stop_codon:yes gene_type:complete
MKKITLLLLTILPLIAFGQFEQLITNHTFDSDISGWNSNGAASWNSTEGFTAAGSAEFVASAGNNFRTSPNTPLDFAGDYTVTFRVKGTNGTTIKAQFFGCCGNPSGPDLAMTGAWLEYTYTFTGLATGSNSNLRIVAVTDGTFFVDDVYFTFNLPPGSTLLTTNVNGAGTIAVTPDKSFYDPTDNVSVEAQPTTHWVFDNWSGDLSGTTNPETILMDSNKTVTANFSIDGSFDYDFLFNSDGDSEGWIETNATASVAGGNLTVTPEADKFGKIELTNFAVSAANYQYLQVTLQNLTTNDDGLRVVVGAENITIPISVSDASMKQYEFDLSTLTTWTGNVNDVTITFRDEDNASGAGKSSGTGDFVIDSIIFSNTTLSSKDFDTVSFSFYPNPASDIVYFKGNNAISKVTVFDITGKQVLTGKLSNNELNISPLKSGLYLLEVEDSNQNKGVQKLVVK